jgi:hypothetical protein
VSDETPRIGLPDPTPEQALVLLHDAHVELMLRRDPREAKAALRETLDALDKGCDLEYGTCVPPMNAARVDELRQLLAVLM